MSRPDLEHLDPVFRRDFDALLDACRAHGLQFTVTFGYRSLDEQAALYRAHLAGGPLAAPPGLSAHNFGLACDVLCPHREHDRGGSCYDELAEMAPRYSLETLAKEADFGHVQRIGWKLFHDVQGGSSVK